MLLTLALLSTQVSGDGPSKGLADKPIAAASIIYLDSSHGTSWIATSSGGVPDGCSFQADVDWADGKSLATLERPSASACCEACWSEALCTAAVYRPANSTCALKRGLAATPITVPGTTACLKKRAAPLSLTVPASVPGDLLTDLQRAGVIGDPLREKNFLNDSLWQRHTWTYTASFGLPAEALSGASGVLLVFEGIKMGARVSVNGVALGVADDQFLRFTFPLGSAHGLRATDNVLSVEFDEAIDCHGRFMACTGGWDWAPYSHSYQGGARVFSKGIWKPVYVAFTAAAAITHVVPQIRYLGAYPTARLTDASHGGFSVDVRLHFYAHATTLQTVVLNAAWRDAPVRKTFAIPAGESNVTLALGVASGVRLWWPVGLGSQTLYTISVELDGSAGAVPASPSPPPSGAVANRTVGFRYFAFVTGNDTDPAYVANASGQEGTMGHGMYFRVNGVALYSKGANVIPMEELEGRMSAEAHVQLVSSAVAGAFNTLRVWGGGIFLPDAFYEAYALPAAPTLRPTPSNLGPFGSRPIASCHIASIRCDEQGILIYHDMQYAQQGHAPKATSAQDAELRHQARDCYVIAMRVPCDCHVIAM